VRGNFSSRRAFSRSCRGVCAAINRPILPNSITGTAREEIPPAYLAGVSDCSLPSSALAYRFVYLARCHLTRYRMLLRFASALGRNCRIIAENAKAAPKNRAAIDRERERHATASLPPPPSLSLSLSLFLRLSSESAQAAAAHGQSRLSLSAIALLLMRGSSG